MTTQFRLSVAIDPLHAEENTDAIEAMEESLDSADNRGATIFSEQIPAQDWKSFFIVDIRDAAQFEKEHIPGAVWEGSVRTKRAESSD